MTRPASFSLSSRILWSGVFASALLAVFIWWIGAHWLERPEFAPDRPSMWYLWQLQDPSVLTRTSAWIGYVLHQLSIWALIWLAQRSRPAYTSGLHGFNIIALAVNAAFVLLHVLQTYVWYDGLAQDVPEWTAQWSVILILVAVLIMENQRRGLILGRPLEAATSAGAVVRRYHGYYFAWAAIYTFWYHPTESTFGHLVGFFYMFMILFQGSLFFTRAHTNRYWTVVLEMFIVVHAVAIAATSVSTNGPSWTMFASGGIATFVITQMHGLGWSKRVRVAAGLLYIAAVGIIYSQIGWIYSYEIVALPVAAFLVVLCLSLLIVALGRLAARWADGEGATR